MDNVLRQREIYHWSADNILYINDGRTKTFCSVNRVTVELQYVFVPKYSLVYSFKPVYILLIN